MSWSVVSEVPRYLPILKGRQGEFNALGEVAPVTREYIVPLIEANPPSDRDDPKVIRENINKCAAKLGNVWGGQDAFLDSVHLDLGMDLGGHGATYALCRGAEEWNIRAVPVLRLDDPELARNDVRRLSEEAGRGVCVRLVGEDIDADPDDLQDAFSEFFRACRLEKSDADLVLDAAVVDSEIAARGAARVMGSLLRDLDDIVDWRSVTVASGAFPIDLSAYDPWVIGERSRFDADMWAHVRNRRRLARSPGYGDYAVAHPSVSTTSVSFSPAPQLRYTTADQWLILKGRRNDPAGNQQFYDVCERISRDPRFVGAALGAADARIAHPRRHGPGNATTWRQIGTTHHLDFVVRRITTLGEP
ncbi:MAG TPA: beta family protein [Micromonosporaceae bacterium]|nr:beta family protein [Micromonosporaceae bacterium]